MKRFAIITDDNSVYYDGESINSLDLSTIDPEIHAIQWDGKYGHIEYKTLRCEHCGGVSRKQNEPLSDPTPYQPIIDAYIVVKQAAIQAALDAEAAQKALQESATAGAVNVIAD